MTDRLTTTEYRARATEAQIQAQIVRYLTSRRIPHSVTDATEAFNRNGRRVRRVKRGWPDLVGCIPAVGRGNGVACGAFLAIEVKSAKGKLRPDQARTLHELYRAGALVVIARSVGDLIEVLRTGRIRECDVEEIKKYKDKLK